MIYSNWLSAASQASDNQLSPALQAGDNLLSAATSKYILWPLSRAA